MNLEIDQNKELEDNEGGKYGYSFDYDVMHSFMLKPFKPFFRTENFLELERY